MTTNIEITKEFCQETTKKILEEFRKLDDSGWDMDPRYADHHWAGVFTNPEDMGIFCNYTAKRGKIVITGASWNKFKDVTFKTDHISISLNRTPEAIAKDIYKKLLPSYREAFRDATRKQKEHDDEQNKRVTAIEKLASAFAGKSRVCHNNYRKNNAPTLDIIRGEGTVGGEVNACYDDTFDITLTGLNFKQVREILSTTLGPL